MAGFKFTALNQAIDAEIMHAEHVGGFLHRIGEPLNWRRYGGFFIFGNGFHTSSLVASISFGRNHRFGLLAPINFGKKILWIDAQRHGQAIQLQQINPQGAVFNFGDSAARNVMPTCELQLVGEHVLRPTVFVALSADKPPDEIPLLHLPIGHFISLCRPPFASGLVVAA